MSLEVAIFATVLGVFIGVVLGTLAGFYGGLIDTVVSRMTEIVMAFPLLLFAIGIAAHRRPAARTRTRSSGYSCPGSSR